MSTGTPALARQHFEAMGTVISLAAPGDLPAETINAVRERFEHLEAIFSLHRAESEASRIADGELSVTKASPTFRAAWQLCREWRDQTGGDFLPHDRLGCPNLTGLVKAIAIDEAGALLDGAGITDWAINVGGDILIRGRAMTGEAWVAGIVDPADRHRLISQYRFEARPSDPRAIATSGVGERGEHVWRPTGDDTFAQVSVVAADIVTADALATAILAGGPARLDAAAASFPIEVLAFDRVGEPTATPGFLTSLPNPGRSPAAVSSSDHAHAV